MRCPSSTSLRAVALHFDLEISCSCDLCSQNFLSLCETGFPLPLHVRSSLVSICMAISPLGISSSCGLQLFGGAWMGAASSFGIRVQWSVVERYDDSL